MGLAVFARWRWLAVVLVVVVLGGCTVRLTGDYDPEIDRGLQLLQAETAFFLYRMERAAATPAQAEQAAYAANTDFYDRARADLHVLTLRARQDPLNQRLAAVMENVDANLELLRGEHEAEGAHTFAGDGAAAWLRILDQDFELALKIMTARRKGASAS